MENDTSLDLLEIPLILYFCFASIASPTVTWLHTDLPGELRPGCVSGGETFQDLHRVLVLGLHQLLVHNVVGVVQPPGSPQDQDGEVEVVSFLPDCDVLAGPLHVRLPVLAEPHQQHVGRELPQPRESQAGICPLLEVCVLHLGGNIKVRRTISSARM